MDKKSPSSASANSGGSKSTRISNVSINKYISNSSQKSVGNIGHSAAYLSTKVRKANNALDAVANPQVSDNLAPRPLTAGPSTTPNARTILAKSSAGLYANRSQTTSNSNFRLSVEKAIREHKIFTIVGAYPAVRNALRKRGWIEKNFNSHLALKSMNKEYDSSPSLRGSEEESDQAWLLRVLKDYPPDFVWMIRRDNIEWRLLLKDQIINRFPKAFFTTKVGIAACIQNIHWYSEPGVAEILFPRCYRLCLYEERSAFIEDFRLTAAFSLLKLFVSTYEKDGETGFSDFNSRLSNLHLEFAIHQVNNYIRVRRHEDIDSISTNHVSTSHWDNFLTNYYDIAQGRSKFNFKDLSGLRMKIDQVRRINQRASAYWPQYHIDGHSSLWICKPGARSRGKGIIILSQLDKVLDLLSGNNFRESNWVAQKYIERPMLVYKTKFDIRQWFIVTDWAPLTVWFYKESYIRFCTKPFSLADFHESVHLCNNAVQCKYTNSNLRDSALPDENMWDCYTFQAYLNTIGKMDAWERIIYSGMKHAIIGVLLASQETIENRRNCFELYGADFMLSEDLKPWLIEINSCPCMASTTSVTARMCASCLEDTIKVVLDRRENKNADTGGFEMVYKQNMVGWSSNYFTAQDLVLTGKKMSRDIDWPGIIAKYNNSRRGSASASSKQLGQLNNRNQKTSSHYEGMTFVDLVEKLRLRDDENQATSSTPHAQKSVESGQATSLDNALQRYRKANQAALDQTDGRQQSTSSSAKRLSPANIAEFNGSLDPDGILKIQKLPVRPADQVTLYNGMPANPRPNKSEGNTTGVKYEMFPLYSQVANRPQNFVTFGNRATPTKSVYANGFNSNVTSPEVGNSKYPAVPLSLLTGHATPVAATMADLFRMSQSAANRANSAYFQPSMVHNKSAGQIQEGKHSTPIMVVKALNTASTKKSGQFTHDSRSAKSVKSNASGSSGNTQNRPSNRSPSIGQGKFKQGKSDFFLQQGKFKHSSGQGKPTSATSALNRPNSKS